ncbi:P-loop containing nucleoside triphosphate hydrolase protein [Ceratobasidium sp. AG-I]|nr:P-loop containing nucleoside triphosphate hydrolase protein [Ceratobasidium sp. AG-I]
MKEYQLTGIMDLCIGRDVFAIIPTGGGKSTLMQGAILADKAAGTSSIGITLVPTKSLADDQAHAANRVGLRAIALHEDSLREANALKPRRDIFQEIEDGRWTNIYLAPEMIMHRRFGQLLLVPQFNECFRYFAVDEAHLVIEWQDFRSAFLEIQRLRNRFVRKVAWLAQSATVEPTREFPTLINLLGFKLDATTVLRLPVDRLGIAYAPRFLAHSASETVFLDLAWVIPHNASGPADIAITVIFAEKVEQVTRICGYLTGLLSKSFESSTRAAIVQPITSVMSNEHNRKVIQDMRNNGSTRVIVCTDTGALGIDIPQVQRVVVLVEAGTTYRMLCQKMGRIRTSGLAVLYFHQWMNASKRSQSYANQRSEVEKVMVDFANSTPDKCPRAVNVEYWGDIYEPTSAGQPCCNIHNPELDTKHLEMVRASLAHLKSNRTRQQASIRSDRTYRPPDEDVMQPIARKMVYEWRRVNLAQSVGYTSLSPLSRILPDHLVVALVKKLHLCTNIERFREVMASWDRLDEWGESLYSLVENIWSTFELDDVAESILTAQARCKEKKQAQKLKENTGQESNHVPEPHTAKPKRKAPTAAASSKKAKSRRKL